MVSLARLALIDRRRGGGGADTSATPHPEPPSSFELVSARKAPNRRITVCIHEPRHVGARALGPGPPRRPVRHWHQALWYMRCGTAATCLECLLFRVLGVSVPPHKGACHGSPALTRLVLFMLTCMHSKRRTTHVAPSTYWKFAILVGLVALEGILRVSFPFYPF